MVGVKNELQKNEGTGLHHPRCKQEKQTNAYLKPIAASENKSKT